MILNLTQHMATPEQIAQGVIEPPMKQMVRDCLTFNEIPSKSEIFERADVLARYALYTECTAAMIGGAGFLMKPLEEALIRYGIAPLHSFSKRESVEQQQLDGTVTKVAIFRHIGFVGADSEEWRA